MSGGGKLKLPQQDDHLDLVPLIDCVFLLLLFFMICGRLGTDSRTEQISVPPTRTAVKFDESKAKWQREIINVFGLSRDGREGRPPANTVRIGTTQFIPQGPTDTSPYVNLRSILDRVYDKAEKYDDPKGTGMKLPKVIIEIRADGNTEYRVVQEVQQILTDSIDPATMQPKKGDVRNNKPFVNLDFTTRRYDEKN